VVKVAGRRGTNHLRSPAYPFHADPPPPSIVNSPAPYAR
jgi:hypothetical protein